MLAIGTIANYLVLKLLVLLEFQTYGDLSAILAVFDRILKQIKSD